MEFALLYPAWDGEGWSSCIALHKELEFRGHSVRHFNTYHNNGLLNHKTKIRQYSIDCMNRLNHSYKNEDYKPDVFLLMDYGVFDHYVIDKKFFPDVIFLAELGDCPQSFRNHQSKFPKFHGFLTPDYQCNEILNQNNHKSIFWTHFADERIFYPRSNINIEFDCVTTCGSRGNGVTEKIKESLGAKFENSRYYYGEDHPKQLCKGMMVFQCSQFKEITRRIFEGMACGRMVITDRLPEVTHINDLFIENKDIVYYDSAEDAIEKIRYYASHTRERETIAKAGYENVMQNHTVSTRVDQLEDFVEHIKRERFSDV